MSQSVDSSGQNALELASNQPFTSDHSLLIAIHKDLNQLIGQMTGHVKKIDGVENRLNMFENSCTVSKEQHRARIDSVEKKIDQWTGGVKVIGGVVGLLSAISVFMQIWRMGHL